MGSRSDNINYRRSELGRSVLETVYTLPSRWASALRVEDMDDEVKGCAHFSNEVYNEPDSRRTELRGHTLLKGNIPKKYNLPERRESVPLNDKRWAVYRAPNGLDHVLVFRGTKDKDDLGHDLRLGMGFGEHEYMIEAAVWSSQVMLFLDGKGRLRFRVTGHSLGGAVAMSVILHLHNIPVASKYIADDAKTHNRPPELSITFKQKVKDPWEDAISKTGIVRPYEVSGGHVFNPGAWPRQRNFPRDYTALMTVAGGAGALVDAHAFGSVALAGLLTAGTGTAMVTANVVSSLTGFGVLLGGSIFLLYRYNQTHGGTDSRPDKGVTTHHIIGDLISCSYRMGKEKSYMPKRKRAFLLARWPAKNIKSWGPHSIENFL